MIENVKKNVLVLVAAILVSCSRSDNKAQAASLIDESQLFGPYQIRTTEWSHLIKPDGASVKTERETFVRLELNEDHTFYYDKVVDGVSSYPVVGVWSLEVGNRLFYSASHHTHKSSKFCGVAEVNTVGETLNLKDYGLFRFAGSELFVKGDSYKFNFKVDDKSVASLKKELSKLVDSVTDFEYKFTPADSLSQFKADFSEAVKNKDAASLTQLTYFKADQPPLYYYLDHYNSLFGSQELEIEEMSDDEFQNAKRLNVQYGLECPEGTNVKGCIYVRKLHDGGSNATGRYYGIVDNKWAIITGLAATKK